MDYPSCNRSSCINWKDGHCKLKDPEKTENACLSYDDAMDFLRLKADAITGTM